MGLSPQQQQIVAMQLQASVTIKTQFDYFGFYQSLLAEPSDQSKAMTSRAGRPGPGIVPNLSVSGRRQAGQVYFRSS